MSRSERLIALVEAAIERLEEGDLDAARAKLNQAARIDPRHPDLLAVQASLAMIDGDLDRAMELAGKAVEVAPDDIHVLLAAADIALAVEPETAIEHARRAADLCDEEDDLITAILILADAYAATDRAAEARAALGELATSAIDDAETILDVAHAYLGAEDPTTAELWLRRITGRGDDDALGGDPAHAADAWHGIGQCREAKHDKDGMIAAWLETRRRDAAAASGGATVDDDQLEAIVTAALDELPPEVHTRLAGVPILVDDLPSEDLVKDGWDPRLLGLFEGTPMPEQSSVGGVPSVTTIHLFRRNLERVAGDDVDLLAEEIRVTVLHETAHYFGLDDADLEKLGLD